MDDFLVVLDPLAPVRFSDIVHHALDDTEGWATLSAEFPETFPDPRFPAEGGLLPFARSDNGAYFCWRAEGPPDAWTSTVIDMRRPAGRHDHSRRHGEPAGGLLGRTAPANIVTEWFPAAAPRFRPHRRH